MTKENQNNEALENQDNHDLGLFEDPKETIIGGELEDEAEDAQEEGQEQPEEPEQPEESDEADQDDRDSEVEKLEKSKAFYQSEYQAAMGYLRQIDPTAADNFLAGRPERQEARPSDAQQALNDEPDDSPYSEYDVVGDMPPDVFQNFIADVVEKKFTKVDSARDQRQTLQNEIQQASQVVSKMAQQFQASDDEINEAFDYMESFGIDPNSPGGATKRAKLVIDNLRQRAIMRQMATPANQIPERGSNQEQLRRVSQPTGSTPAQKKKSINERALDAMEGLGGSKTDRLFSEG